MLRDGWKFVRADETVWIYEKTLPGGWILRREFPQGYDWKQEVYRQRHTLLTPEGIALPQRGPDWCWADHDDYRKRLVYAACGILYAADLKQPSEPVPLYDFNDMKYEPQPAPY